MPKFTFKEPTLRDNSISNFFVFLTLAIIILSAFFLLEIYGIIFYVLVIIFSISLLVIWHSSARGFKCTHFQHEFGISFWQDLPTASSILIKKKLLTCPECGVKDYTTELVKEKSNQ